MSTSPEGAPTEELLTLKLKPREEDRVRAGHCWIFSNEIENFEKSAVPGSLAVAVTSGNQSLGLGFFNPRSLIAWRRLSPHIEPIDKEFFKNKFAAAAEFRERFYPGLGSFRLCFGESDGLPGLVIDKYGDVFVVQALAAGMDCRLDIIARALEETFSAKGIYLQGEHPSRVLEGLKTESRLLAGDVPSRVVIEQHGLRFIVPILEGQKTGFYFDQRDNREAVALHARGRRVLDLYSYVGAFGLVAARAGAEKVLGLDSSEMAVKIARENAELNGLAGRCQFDEGSAEEVLEAFAQPHPEFKPDLILLDPPSFVPSRKHQMKGLRAYAKLNTLALRALRPGGLLATSTCSHHVGREEFVSMLREAAAKAGKRLKLLELGTQAKDHPILLAMPETQYLHFALLEVY